MANVEPKFMSQENRLKRTNDLTLVPVCCYVFMKSLKIPKG